VPPTKHADVLATFSSSSSITRLTADVIRPQVTYGGGIQNYINDASVDVGIKNSVSNRRSTVVDAANTGSAPITTRSPAS